MPQSTVKSQIPLVQKFAHLPFRKARHDETAAQLGLITLETDLTIETELHHFIGDSIGTKVGLGQKPTPIYLHSGQKMTLGIENLGIQNQMTIDEI